MNAILMYHSIDSSGSVISVSPESFERHLDYFSSHLEVHSLESLLSCPDDGRHRVALTFDDAFQNFADEAWPRLREAGLPATLYVTSARVGRDNRWNGIEVPGVPTLPLCDWETLSELADEGCSIGAHSLEHPHLSRLSPERKTEEILGSSREIESRLGKPCRSFAYPFGDFDTFSLNLVREHFETATTTELASLGAQNDPHLLPRLDAYYWRDSRGFERFGDLFFRGEIRLRSFLRKIRSALRIGADQKGAPELAQP